MTMPAPLRRAFTLSVALGAIGLAVPAAAQDEDTKVNMVYITEDEECPASTADTITVCGILEEQFRIPRALRNSDDPENSAWSPRVSEFQTVGDTGINSCSPVGPAGATGCTQELIRKAYADRANSPEVRFGRAIEDARADRLSTIDEDAAAEQARVEQIERQYMERLERERQGPVPGEAVDPSLPPVIDDAERVPPAEPEKPGPFDDGDETPQPVGPQVPGA